MQFFTEPKPAVRIGEFLRLVWKIEKKKLTRVSISYRTLAPLVLLSNTKKPDQNPGMPTMYYKPDFKILGRYYAPRTPGTWDPTTLET